MKALPLLLLIPFWGPSIVLGILYGLMPALLALLLAPALQLVLVSIFNRVRYGEWG